MGSKGFAKIGNFSLYYETAGTGAPLVLIHGYTLDTRMWDDQMAAFTQKHLVLRYDMRGFGKSSFPRGGSFAHHEDLKALLDQLGIQRAHILGFSLGAAYAINFALAYPEKTLSLIPVDTSALDGFWWPERLNQPFAMMGQAAANGDMELARQYWLSTDWFIPIQERPELAARLYEIVQDYSCWHFTHDENSHGVTPPANDQLTSITAPTLVVVGERDLEYYNHPLADHLVQRIPNARKVVIPKAGHMCNMEDPQTFNQVVLSFLDEVDGQRMQ